jgi:hypothetical protein
MLVLQRNILDRVSVSLTSRLEIHTIQQRLNLSSILQLARVGWFTVGQNRQIETSIG